MKTCEFIRQVPPLAWLIMVSVLCGGLFGNLLGSLTPEISADLSLSPKQLGWLVFWGSAGSAIGAFLGGDMVYRFRPRKLIFVYQNAKLWIFHKKWEQCDRLFRRYQKLNFKTSG